MQTFVRDKRIKLLREFEGEEKKYYGLKLNKDEADEIENDFNTFDDNQFYAKYFIYKEDMIAVGNPEFPPTELFNLLVPHKLVRPATSLSHKDKPVVKSYKCFGSTDYYGKDSIITIHQDTHSAWNCLLEHCNNPEYLVIFKK